MADLALSFSTSNLQEMLTEAQHQTGADYQPGRIESTYTLEAIFGRLIYRHIRLRHGLSLLINQWDLDEPLKVTLDAQNYAAFELSFCITGQFQGQFDASSTALFASPGKNFSSLAQGDIRFTTEYSAQNPVSTLTINVDPVLGMRGKIRSPVK